MHEISQLINEILPFLQSPLGTLCFIPLYALWVSLLLPGIWASMLAGFIYGTLMGSAIVFLGACLGAEVVFLMGRTFLRSWAKQRLEQLPRIKAVEKAVSKEGLKIVLLTRLSPAFPFSLLNLSYGLSDIKLIDYTIGLIAILPGTVLFCGLGAFAGDLSNFGEVLSGNSNQQVLVLRVLGLISTFAVVWFVGRSAQKILQESDPSL